MIKTENLLPYPHAFHGRLAYNAKVSTIPIFDILGLSDSIHTFP